MKLPLRLAGLATLKTVDFLLDQAIKVDRWWRERKERDPKGLRFQDVKRINDAAHAAGHERSRAKTVVLPKDR